MINSAQINITITENNQGRPRKEELSSHKLRLFLTPAESNALKGIALLLLLWHHLFYIQNGLYDDVYIAGHGFVNTFGIVCKVCVALFVFLSGYGLTASAARHSTVDWKRFFVHRYTKLYLNYWLIWVLFVPVGVFCLDLGFEKVYGTDFILPLISDFTGTLNLFGKYGYNPTWWFYSCIIVLYALFPLIFMSLKCSIAQWSMLVLSIAVTFVTFTFIQPIRFYLIAFILGCVFYNGLSVKILPPHTIAKAIAGDLNAPGCVVLLLLLTGTMLLRLISGGYGLLVDTLVALLIILVFKNISLGRLNPLFQFLGRHSFNIFLFHTFLFYLYFQEMIYWSRNPVVIFLTLTLWCVGISYVIEMIKSGIHFKKLQDTISGLI